MEESASLPDGNQLGTEIIGQFISPLSFFSGRMTEWLRDTKQAIVSSPPTARQLPRPFGLFLPALPYYRICGPLVTTGLSKKP